MLAELSIYPILSEQVKGHAHDDTHDEQSVEGLLDTNVGQIPPRIFGGFDIMGIPGMAMGTPLLPRS